MKHNRYIAEYDNPTTGRVTFERFSIPPALLYVEGRVQAECTHRSAIARAEALSGINRKLVGVYAANDLRKGE